MRRKGSFCFHLGVAFWRDLGGESSTSVGVPGTAEYSCEYSDDLRLWKSSETLRTILVPRSSLWRIDSNV
jgi:hypothetical protein